MIIVFYLIAEKMAKKRAKNVKSLYVCPKCGSINLRYIDDILPGTRFISTTPSNNEFECIDCGYQGIAPKVDREQINSFREEIKKNKNNNSLKRKN